MKLQLALDVLSTEQATGIADAARSSIDIIEVGTPLLKHEGTHVIETLRKWFPDKTLLVDTKTMDAGAYETDFCFAAGGDIVTVLGVADDDTIRGALESAKKHSGRVLVDLINVPNKLERIEQLTGIGVDMFGIHSGIDQQQRGASPLEDLLAARAATDAELVAAGGIGPNTIEAIVAAKPAVIVVGGAITGAPDPGRAAAELHSHLPARGGVS